jgi:membrane associated rhomboid family serine protease
LWNSSRTAGKAILTTALSGFFLFILFGLSPDSDIIAHAGGFVGGLVMGGLLALLPSKVIQDKRVQIAAAGVFIGLLIVSWLLALRPVS